jgi:GT2 family glycosyltransferase
MNVTVVIASRDRQAQLDATLPRHRALGAPVIVVDDASAMPLDVPAEVVRLERSRGGAARNAGVEAARTPYVALTDDDGWWEPGALARAAALLDTHPRLAVVQAHVLVGPARRDDPTCVAMAATPLTPDHDQPGHPILSFIACAVVVRREAFLACGGFSARLGVGGEEELLGWDLLTAGWQLSYVPEVVAHHDPPPAPGGRPARRVAQLRNALWSAWLRRPAGAAARASAAALARAPLDRTTLRAAREAAAGAPWVLRERRVSPPRVEAMRRRLENRSPSDRDG